MKVELSIADDRELRNAIKDLIKGEVVSIMRGEIKTIIADLVKENALPRDVKDLEGMLRAEVGTYAREQLRSSGYNQSFIREIAHEEVAKILKEIFEKAQYNIEKV